MRRSTAFLLMLLLLAVAGAAWVFLAGGDDFRDEAEPYRDPTQERVGVSPPLVVEEATPRLSGSVDSGERRGRRKPLWPVIPSDQIPRGVLEVLPVYADGTPVDAHKVRVRLVREGAAFYAPSLGVPDYDTQVWRFERVVIGWLRIVVSGDHLLEARVRAEVSKGRTEEVQVTVERGGAIEYQAELYSGEPPDAITLELRHPETNRPQSVHWEVRAHDAYSPARRSTSVTQGAKGVVFGIPPGRWILHATSPAGEIDQVDLEVRADETVKAEIKLRR